MSLDYVIDLLNKFFDTAGAPLVVALFFWFRFHTLKGTRSFTTWPLFAFGVAVFITPFMLLYWLFVQKLWPLAAIWLVISAWLIPVVPALWRGFCHQLAGIPASAHGLRDALAKSSFDVRPDDMPSLQRKLARVGYQIDDFRAVQSTAIQSRLLKISALMLHLERWAGERFMKRNSDIYTELLAAYDALCFRTVRVLRSSAEIYGAIMEDNEIEPDNWEALDSLSTRHSTVSQLQLAAQTAAGCMLEDLRKDMDSLLSNLLLFAVRGALAGEWTLARSKRRLNAIGFALDPSAPGILKFVVVLAVFTFGWALLWLIGSDHVVQIPGDPFVGVLRTLTVTPLYFIVNFSTVYHLKRQYGFANENIFGRMPAGFILSVGLFSALLFFLIQLPFDVYQFPKRPSIDVILHDLPLLIFPWGIGAMTALLVQDSTWDRRSKHTRRVRDGLVLGGGMTVLLFLLLAIHQVIHMPAMELVDGISAETFVKSLLLPTFGLGFTVGCSMMEPLREAAARRQIKSPVLTSPLLVSA